MLKFTNRVVFSDNHPHEGLRIIRTSKYANNATINSSSYITVCRVWV